MRVRGESGRVAARVRELLRDYDEDGADTYADDRLTLDVPGGTPWQRVMTRLPVPVAGVRPAALTTGVVAIVGILLIGLWLRSGQTGPPDALGPVLPTEGVASTTPVSTESVSAASAGTTTSGSPSATGSPSVVVVDVAGRVRHPGVYRLPAGSRVEDALRAAGGARPGVNLNSLNLAAVVTDGEQIPVGILAAAGAQSGAGAGPDGASTGPVDLNTATLEQLETLPGVGPVLGQRILDWRTEHGAFASVDQLDDVPGIGATRLAELAPLVTV